MRTPPSSLLLAGVAALLVGLSASGEATAKPRHHRVTVVAENDIQSLPLTVNRRSWLDPGNAAPAGGGVGPSYVQATGSLARTIDRTYTDKFGNSIDRGAPYVPGRPVPVVSFETLPNGGYDVDNVLHYQPD